MLASMNGPARDKLVAKVPLGHTGNPTDIAEAAYLCSPAAGYVTGVDEVLRDSGIRVCMITGLSRRLLGIVLDTLGWWRLVDLALSPEDVPRGCPWPDQMLAAMLRVGVEDVREAAYAGSTASGVAPNANTAPTASDTDAMHQAPIARCVMSLRTILPRIVLSDRSYAEREVR